MLILGKPLRRAESTGKAEVAYRAGTRPLQKERPFFNRPKNLNSTLGFEKIGIRSFSVAPASVPVLFLSSQATARSRSRLGSSKIGKSTRDERTADAPGLGSPQGVGAKSHRSHFSDMSSFLQQARKGA
jgi:hypothetical protein